MHRRRARCLTFLSTFQTYRVTNDATTATTANTGRFALASEVIYIFLICPGVRKFVNDFASSPRNIENHIYIYKSLFQDITQSLRDEHWNSTCFFLFYHLCRISFTDKHESRFHLDESKRSLEYLRQFSE